MNLNIKLSESKMNRLKREADQLEITPNMLIRIRVCELYGEPVDDSSKAYVVRMENWRELEAYVKGRGFGDLSIFLNKAAVGYMKKNRLASSRKDKIEVNIEK
jgi:hypothetical protein